MNKPLLYIAIIDILSLLFLSSLGGGAFYLLGFEFIPTALLTFLFLCVSGVITNKILSNRVETIHKKMDLQTVKLLTSQTVSVNCAYCRAPNEQFLNLDTEMTFDCAVCKQPNKVLLQYGAVRVTTPLNVSLPTEDLIPNEALDKEEA